jgi:hypothetical protein
MKLKHVLIIFIVLALFSPAAIAVSCGNGIREGIEECDDGDYNSDNDPDACRTDCMLPHCGDNVEDSDEECDDGEDNSDEIPDACRTDCQEAHCGDGVIDVQIGEQCDVGDADANNGCHQCLLCYKPADNLHITESGKFCEPKIYNAADTGEEGVIIIDGSAYGESLLFDCNGVELRGKGGVAMQADTAKGGVIAKVIGVIKGFFTGGNSNTKATGKATDAPSDTMTKSPESPSSDSPSSKGDVVSGQAMVMKVGTGIYIKGVNVVLKGCTVKNYRNGIKIDYSDNVLVDNVLCGNTKDISAANTDNFGAKNSCDNVLNWRENGVDGCTFTCDGDTNTVTECPDCVCEECPICELLESEEEPEEQEPEPEEEPEEEPEPEEEQEEPEQKPVEEKKEEPEEAELTEEEYCIKKYMASGYSEESAKRMCLEKYAEEPTEEPSEEEPEEITPKLTTTVVTETTTTEESDCVRKYISEGYSQDEAEEKCSGETTTTTIPTVRTTTTLTKR